MTRRVVVAVCTIGALACPAAASAAPTWLAPVTVGDGAAQAVVTAMAPDGTALIARVRSAGTYEVLEAIVKPPGQPSGAPLEIGRSTNARRILGPTATAGVDGRFVVDYYDAAGAVPGEGEGRMVTLAPDGQPVDRLSQAQSTMSFDSPPKPVLDGHGGVNYFVDPDGLGGAGISVYRRAGGSGKVLPIPYPAGDPAPGVMPSMSAAPDGRLLITYAVSKQLPGDCNDASEVWLNEGVGDTLGQPVKVTSNRVTGVRKAGECTDWSGWNHMDTAAVADAAGAMTIAFQEQDRSDKPQRRVSAIHRPAGGAWGPVEPIGPSVEGPLRVTMAGSTPTVTVESIIVLWSARGADGTWRPTTPIYAHGGWDLTNTMAPLADGSTIYVWSQDSLTGTSIKSLRARPDGTLEDPIDLVSAPGSGATVGNDTAGNAIAAYIGSDGKAHYIPFDGAGPVVEGVSIPGQSPLGEQRQYSVSSVRDVWSPVTLTWLFSDNGSATGASVTHAFTEPGTQTARLRATDAAGNRTTVTGTVEVPAPAPATAPAPSPPAAAPRDATAPRFTTKPTLRKGTLRFALSESATVVAVVTRKATGVRRGKRCVAPPRRKTKARTCTRQVAVATVRARLQPGAGKLALPKKAQRAKGTYTIALTVTDAAGNVSRTKTTYRVS